MGLGRAGSPAGEPLGKEGGTAGPGPGAAQPCVSVHRCAHTPSMHKRFPSLSCGRRRRQLYVLALEDTLSVEVYIKN